VIDPGMFADDYVGHRGLGSGGEGAATVRTHLSMWYEAAPDVNTEVLHTVTDGDWVATFAVVRGTQTGDFIGLPASGNPFELGATDMFRVRGGRIVEGFRCNNVIARGGLDRQARFRAWLGVMAFRRSLGSRYFGIGIIGGGVVFASAIRERSGLFHGGLRLREFARLRERRVQIAEQFFLEIDIEGISRLGIARRTFARHDPR
jgi:predicted ester cyclase